MRHLLAALAITLTLTACSAGTSDTQSIPAQGNLTTTQKRPTATQERPDTTRFIATMASDAPAFHNAIPDSELIDIGLTMCSFLDQGNSTEDMTTVLYQYATRNGHDQYLPEFATLAAASIVFLCPRHRS